MKNIKGLYSNNAVCRFMISYVGVLLIPLLVCLMSYQISFNIVKDSIEQNNLSIINTKKNSIDEQLKMIQSLMLQAVNNGKIVSFAQEKSANNSTFYYDASDVVEELYQTFKYANVPILDNIYVYLTEEEYIITRYDMYKAKFFHKNVLKSAMDYESWSKQFKDVENYGEYIVSPDTITYMQMLPMGLSDTVKGVVVCDISKKALTNLFDTINVNEETKLYIRDKAGKVLLELSNSTIEPPMITKEELEQGQSIYSTTFNGEDSFIINVRSTFSGWIYTLVLPSAVVLSNLNSLKVQIFTLFALALFIGVVISYYMATKNGKPMEEIKSYLKLIFAEEDIQADMINDTHTLSGTMEKIVSKTQDLKEELDKQRPYLESAFFQKLIKGEFTTTSELQAVAKRACIEFKSDSYVVINCRIFVNNDMYYIDDQTLEEVGLLIMLIKEQIKEVIGQETYLFDIDQLTTSIIIEGNNESYSRIVEQIGIINKNIVDEYKITPFWGISAPCTNLVCIWRAFEQAKKAMKSGIEQECNNIVLYNEIDEDKTTYYYPLTFEKRLLTYTKEADRENIESLLDLLYVENFEKRELSEETIDNLYLEINSTIIKFIQDKKEYNCMEELKELAKDKDLESIKRYFAKVQETYLEIASSFKQVKTRQQTKLINRIINYIDEVYMNPNLGLGMVATKFNISEGYISTLFKEQTNINFTDYVEKQRINKACELLVETKLNINDISEKVGYNSVQSFRRAFKRLHGISPSELRKDKK